MNVGYVLRMKTALHTFEITRKADDGSDVVAHYVCGEVYAPLILDTQGETMTAEDVRELGYEFMRRGMTTALDKEHDLEFMSGVVVVESFIARENDPQGFTPGAWVLTSEIKNDEIWQKIVAGELNAYSASFLSLKVSAKVIVQIARVALGETDLSIEGGELPPHSHGFEVSFDADGKVVHGGTTEDLGHRHIIISNTTTEQELGHAHRWMVVG